MPATAVDRTVLIASYHFPPDSVIGSIRPARFARHLRRLGWQPVVLTASDRDRTEGVDREQLLGLENVDVLAVRRRQTIRTMYSRLKQRVGLNGQETAATDHQSTPRGRIGAAWAAVRRHLIALVVFLPDQHKLWSIRAAARAVRLIRRNRIALVVTTAPPASTHIVGIAAKAFTRARWIADFRDPWLESLEARPARARTRIADAIEARMERAVVARADLVVTTTERLSAALRARYSAELAREPLWVPNAVDLDQFDSAEHVGKFDRFTITYAGSLYEGRTPEPLFRAVQQLIAGGHLTRDAIAMKFIGRCEDSNGVPTLDLARRYDLEDAVEVLPQQPRSTALHIMRRSHLLLVLAPAHHRLIVPAKLYDYVASGTRVIAIAENGATTDVLDGSAWGMSFAPSDVDGIRDYLATLTADRAAVQPGDKREFLQTYDAAAVTSRLSAAMTDLCNAPCAS